jgi:hypothetical protein
MGHSEYDPVAKEQRPWNAGRKLGAKRALKPQQVWAISFDVASGDNAQRSEIVRVRDEMSPRGRITMTITRATPKSSMRY